MQANHKSTILRELYRNVATRGRYAKEYRQQVVKQTTSKRHHDKLKHICFTEELKQQTGEWLRRENSVQNSSVAAGACREWMR